MSSLRRLRYPNKFFLATEATYEFNTQSAGHVAYSGNWSRGEGYAADILGNLNAGASGWIDWNLWLDENGGPNHVGNDCDAAVLVNTTSHELFVHPQYWYIGHISKFVPPGAVRVDATVQSVGQRDMSPTSTATTAPDDCQGWPRYGFCRGDALQVGAFVRSAAADNGDELVVVVLNCGDVPRPFYLDITDWGIYIANTAIAHAIQTYVVPRASALKNASD